MFRKMFLTASASATALLALTTSANAVLIVMEGGIFDQNGNPWNGGRISAGVQLVDNTWKWSPVVPNVGADGKYRVEMDVANPKVNGNRVRVKTIAKQESAPVEQPVGNRGLVEVIFAGRMTSTSLNGLIDVGDGHYYINVPDRNSGPIVTKKIVKKPRKPNKNGGKLGQDPVFSFTPSSSMPGELGVITTAFDDDPECDTAPIIGVAEHANGQVMTGNDFDINGSPVTESLFGQAMKIDPIHVFAATGRMDGGPGGFSFSDTHVSIKDANGGTSFDADITNLALDDDGGFIGSLRNIAIGPSAGSGLLTDWNEALADGEGLQINFDSSIVAASGGFTTAGAISSYVGVNAVAVPEPALAILPLLGTATLIARRRRVTPAFATTS